MRGWERSTDSGQNRPVWVLACSDKKNADAKRRPVPSELGARAALSNRRRRAKRRSKPRQWYHNSWCKQEARPFFFFLGGGGGGGGDGWPRSLAATHHRHVQCPDCRYTNDPTRGLAVLHNMQGAPLKLGMTVLFFFPFLLVVWCVCVCVRGGGGGGGGDLVQEDTLT